MDRFFAPPRNYTLPAGASAPYQVPVHCVIPCASAEHTTGGRWDGLVGDGGGVTIIND